MANSLAFRRFVPGTPFDIAVRGRVGTTGYVTSGRRWHRRIPSLTPTVRRGHRSSPRQGDETLATFPVAGSLSWATDWFVSRSPDCSSCSTGACAHALRSAQISDLRDNPGRYQHRTVSVDGTVTTSWGVPLRAVQALQSRRRHRRSHRGVASGRTPTRGAHVRVKGRVDDVAVIGGQAVGLHLREEALYVKR